MISLLEYINKTKTSEYTTDKKDPNNWEVGDVLYGTAGFTMTLPRFYKIVKKTNKTFTVRRLEGKIVSGHHNGQWQEVATDKFYDGAKDETCRVNKWGYVRLGGKYGFSLSYYDGHPVYGDDMD